MSEKDLQHAKLRSEQIGGGLLDCNDVRLEIVHRFGKHVLNTPHKTGWQP